jgi:hypothetical protein
MSTTMSYATVTQRQPERTRQVIGHLRPSREQPGRKRRRERRLLAICDHLMLQPHPHRRSQRGMHAWTAAHALR